MTKYNWKIVYSDGSTLREYRLKSTANFEIGKLKREFLDYNLKIESIDK